MKPIFHTALFSALAVISVSLTGCNKPADTPPAKTATSTTTTTVVTSSTANTPAISATAVTSATSATTGTRPMAGKTIRVATEGTYKSFSITNPDGTMTGFDIELMRALCADMQANCDIKPQDWDGLIPGLLAKKYDVVIDAMSITPERLAQVDFTDPYFVNTLVFLVKKGSTINPDDPAQIDSHSMAAQRASLASQWMQKNHPKTKIKLYETIDNAFIDLASGRSDLLISDKAPAYYWAKSPEGQGFEVRGKEIDVQDKMGIIVRKGDPLKEEFNHALANVKANGTYDKIFKAYFDESHATP